jgi:hypothetical protein
MPCPGQSHFGSQLFFQNRCLLAALCLLSNLVPAKAKVRNITLDLELHGQGEQLVSVHTEQRRNDVLPIQDGRCKVPVFR